MKKLIFILSIFLASSANAETAICVEDTCITGANNTFVMIAGALTSLVTVASLVANIISKDSLIGKIINFIALNIKVKK